MSFLTKLPRERYSQDAFSGFKTGREFNPAAARAMAWMSQLAYETDDPGKVADILKQWGLALPAGGIVSGQVATVLPTAKTEVVVAVGDTFTVIAFAGTDPLVLADWITDFDAIVTDPGIAHGYATAARAVEPQLRALLQGAAARDHVYVTGHSLGGALAVLTAHAINTTAVDAVYTYGMPRPGDENFASQYNQAVGSRTYRLVHGEDLVPTVAPSFLKFRHVGRHLRCARTGKFDVNALKPGTDSDEPDFKRGLAREVSELLRGPLSGVMSITGRLKLVTALGLGLGPRSMRADPGGIAIELLPPRLRDHMPDRYIGGF
jgi:triacylglycerol lipase